MHGNAAKIEQVLSQINDHNWWWDDGRFAASHKVLLLEWFRRMALWAKALFGRNAFPSWLLWSIPNAIFPSVELSEAQHDLLNARLKKVRRDRDWFVQRAYDLHLRWIAVEGASEVQVYGLPAPYEPLIRFFERGGNLDRYRPGYIGYAFKRYILIPFSEEQIYQLQHLPGLLNLDDETLNQIDAENKRIAIVKGEKLIEQGPKTKVDQTLVRLMAIQWGRSRYRWKSEEALMREFFRRSLMWNRALYGEDSVATPGMWDAPHSIFPWFHMDEAKSDILYFFLDRAGLGSYPLTRYTCWSYLRWVAIEDTPEVRGYNLPAPYEPLIRLFERGGLFRRENCFICLDRGPMIGLPWQETQFNRLAERPPLLDLDDETLDRFDADIVR